jgi:hypothetical protein
VPPGRPRLTPEQYQERLAAYCARYGVTAGDGTLPPFPTGRRETAQHRAWMALYKARRRLTDPKPGPGADSRRRELLAAQQGRCPVCARDVTAAEALDPADAAVPRALVHHACGLAVALARRDGAVVLDRIRAYLWPGDPASPPPPGSGGGAAGRKAPSRRRMRS